MPTRRSESEPPEGGWDGDSADTATSFPDPTALPEPSREVPRVVVRDNPEPVSVTSPSITVPEPAARAVAPARTATQAMMAAAPPVAQTQPAATQKLAPSPSAGLGSAMREEVWAIVRAAVNEATAPLIARNKELEARLDRAEKEIVARTIGVRTTAAQTPPPPVVAPAPTPPPPVAAAAAPEPAAPPPLPRVEAPKALPGPRASIPPQGLGVPVMTVTRPSLDLESVGAVDVSAFDGGRKKKMVARIFVVVLLAIVTACFVAMIASRS